MIKQEQRDILKNQINRGDFPVAASIYQQNTGRAISDRMLQKFLTGERQCLGDKPGAHQPEEMFRAIAQAIQRRKDREKRLNNLAADILASTIEASQTAALY